MRTDAALERTMLACVIDRFGGPERLVPREVPTPAVGPREVLVRVTSASVGPWDAKARRGEFTDGHERFPLILGADGAGTIAALGDDVASFALGDAVYGMLAGESQGGFYAEYVAIDVEHVAPLPPVLALRDAGAVPVAAITALAGIDDALAIRAGQTVLVHGATGGVGAFAVQFARRRGARVIATARGADGIALLRRLGVDEPVDTNVDDVLEAARRFAPGGLDALLALAGGPDLDRALESLSPKARVAAPNGVPAFGRAGIAVQAFDGVPTPPAFARLADAIDAATFTIPIGGMFPLAQAADAHRLLQAGRVLGKIVLTVDDTDDVVEKVA